MSPDSFTPHPLPISVAMATCNGERFLEAQLESLGRQTLRPLELVVSDDQSDDGTESIIEAFAARAPFPVRIHRNERRLGYRENFMRAANLCQGDLIAFCDQDDVWEPQKLAVMEVPFRDQEVLLAYHNARVIDENSEALGLLYRGPSKERRFRPLSLDPWSLVVGLVQVVRKSLTSFSDLQALSVDPYWPEERLAHDQWFLFLASVLGTVVRIPEPLARYRQHEGNQFGWKGRSQRESEPRFLPRNQHFVEASENRRQLLADMENQLTGIQEERANAGVEYYQRLSRRLAERRSIYTGTSLPKRFRALQSLLRDGAYEGPSTTPIFGWGGLLLDSWVAVPLGPWADRLFSW